MRFWCAIFVAGTFKFDGGYVANSTANVLDQFLSIGHQLNFLMVLPD